MDRPCADAWIEQPPIFWIRDSISTGRAQQTVHYGCECSVGETSISKRRE